MRFILDEEHRFAEFWLSNADQDDPKIEEYVLRQAPLWNAKGYLPVIYRSGKEDLYEMTLALLRMNRERAVRKEIELEQRKRCRDGDPWFDSHSERWKDRHRTIPELMDKKYALSVIHTQAMALLCSICSEIACNPGRSE